jgi:hypothetical protein
MSSDFLAGLKLNETVIDDINKFVNSSLNTTMQTITDQVAEERLLIIMKSSFLVIILAITFLFGFLPLLW